MMKLLLPLALAIVIFSSTVGCQSNSDGEWQILTKQNFSSQIRLHPHILLLVTVPWCGESRSLMMEIVQLATERGEEFRSLKLMVMYRNLEKMLANAIGATEGITLLYYHHSVSYKYQGKLRAQSILFSVYPYLSVSPEELPLKRLNSQEDLETFVESTDRALILLELCGWTPRLLAKVKKNVTEYDFGMQGDLSSRSFSGESDRLTVTRGKGKLKEVEHGKLMCGTENGMGGIPWLMEFSSVNDSDTFWDTDDVNFGLALPCTLENFQQFDQFFSKFIAIAREFLLPPERNRFGLITERSLLSSIGIGDSGSWSVMLHSAGCPTCSKIVKEADEVKGALQMDNSIVAELEGYDQDLDPALPANKPSVILFVDRSSESLEIRRKSMEVLKFFREVAASSKIPDQRARHKNDQSEKSLKQAYQVLTSPSEHPRLNLSPEARMIKLKDEMSIMVINEGKHVTLDIASDLQGSSLHEILKNLLQRKKETKLSLLAKEVGFRLLSDDIDIKISDTLPLSTEVRPNQVSQFPSEEARATKTVDLDAEYLPEKESRSEDVKKEADASEQLISIEADQLDGAITENVKKEGNSSSHVESEEERHHNFEGSFFFSDGNYRLLKALTGQSVTPSLVIIDPTTEQHYVCPKEMMLSSSSLAGFLHAYLNGSLFPYRRSETIVQSSREAIPPPFVNTDFHEVNSIPQVTTSSFSKLVLGFNQSNSENASHAWNEDVLVLFSTSWCGFCQRMELVVREVYRAIKGYMKMLKNESTNSNTVGNADNLTNVNAKFPSIYLLDCTLNDCSLILKSVKQREVYPALMLFPAEKKEAVVYEGDISVAGIINFLAHHGSNSRKLLTEKVLVGNIWTSTGKGDENRNIFDSLPTKIHKEAPPRDKYHEILLKNVVPERVGERNEIKSDISKGLHKTPSYVLVGSILTATDKLLTVHPFDNSKIIMVKADKSSGFQGLIFNKLLRWDSFQELEEGLEFLKEAPLSFGGPLIDHGMPLVALTQGITENLYPEVLPGVLFLDQLATIREIGEIKSGNRSVRDYWFFLGYSSWGWDQLFNEIHDGAWTVVDEHSRNLTWPQS